MKSRIVISLLFVLTAKRSPPTVTARGNKIPPDIVPRHDEQEDHAHQAGKVVSQVSASMVWFCQAGSATARSHVAFHAISQNRSGSIFKG